MYIVQVDNMITHHLVERNLLAKEGSPFAQTAAEMLRESVVVLPDAEPGLKHMLEYPLRATAATDDAKQVLEDNFSEVANAVLQVSPNLGIIRMSSAVPGDGMSNLQLSLLVVVSLPALPNSLCMPACSVEAFEVVQLSGRKLALSGPAANCSAQRLCQPVDIVSWIADDV